MFGYVRLHKPEIKMGEYEQYRGVYCTLCRRLGKRYGLPARMTLSYDMTFLALLYMALEENDPAFCDGRCSFNPTKKCARCQNTTGTDMAADIGILLSYYKLRDTLADEGFWKRLGAYCLLPMAKGAHRRAAKRRPEADQWAAAMMEAQRAVEEDNSPSLDRAAEPFALLLGQLAQSLSADERQQLILQRLGYCLGRWIYLIDAAEDLPEDIEAGRYNPYAAARGLTAPDTDAVKAVRESAVLTLNACLAECIAAYNLLDVRRFDGILRNILEQGMPRAQRRVLCGEEQHHE
ncbi:MAG: hypothetical protein IIW40_01350 [Clostridia bacterium]|nr:hypothetical protein [Clostridia bacterium]